MEFKWKLLSQDGRKRGPLHKLKSAIAMLLHLSRWRPSAVICGGYDSCAAWAAFLWCKLFHRRFILWVDSTARDHRPQGISGQIRTAFKRLIVCHAEGVAASGTASAEYMKQLGARQEQVFIAPFSGNPDVFGREAGRVEAGGEKSEYGFPPRLIIYSGRLTRSKGVFVLLEAFQAVARAMPDVGLLVVGHGPDEKEMREFCQEKEIERVFFEGPQPYERMPYYYALADVLAVPTFSDTWAVVVNEALACGVPAVVSRAAGACDDLIADGETGFAVQPGDPNDLAEKLLRILCDSALRLRMADNCRRIIQNYSAEACARGLLAAVEPSLAVVSPRRAMKSLASPSPKGEGGPRPALSPAGLGPVRGERGRPWTEM
jgi:glycosyltransferase involved in cell wall biosynthesis